MLNRLANLAYQQNELKLFNRIYKAAENNSNQISSQLLMFKSMLHKRMRDWPTALQIWESLIASGKDTFFALEELAKYYEHQIKNYRQALGYTQRALNAIDLLDQLDRCSQINEEFKQRFKNRYKRLKSKLS